MTDKYATAVIVTGVAALATGYAGLIPQLVLPIAGALIVIGINWAVDTRDQDIEFLRDTIWNMCETLREGLDAAHAADKDNVIAGDPYEVLVDHVTRAIQGDTQ